MVPSWTRSSFTSASGTQRVSETSIPARWLSTKLFSSGLTACPDSLDPSGPFPGYHPSISLWTICACAPKHSDERSTSQRRSTSPRGRRRPRMLMRPRLHGKRGYWNKSARPSTSISKQPAKISWSISAPMGITPLGWLRSLPGPATSSHRSCWQWPITQIFPWNSSVRPFCSSWTCSSAPPVLCPGLVPSHIQFLPNASAQRQRFHPHQHPWPKVVPSPPTAHGHRAAAFSPLALDKPLSAACLVWGNLQGLASQPYGPLHPILCWPPPSARGTVTTVWRVSLSVEAACRSPWRPCPSGCPPLSPTISIPLYLKCPHGLLRR